MKSVFPDPDEARELTASVEAAAAAAGRLAGASLRISVLLDPVPQVLLVHDSGDVVRRMSYDELFATLAEAHRAPLC